MNKVILCGRLTRDPDVRYSQGEKPMAIARFTIAVDRRVKKEEGNQNQQTADFPNCIAFRKTAEFIEKFCHKGTKLIICGHLQTGKYKNKDGQTVYSTDVVVDDCEFAESKAMAQQNGSNSVAKQTDNSSNTYAVTVPDGFMQISDGIDGDELPFS